MSPTLYLYIVKRIEGTDGFNWGVFERKTNVMVQVFPTRAQARLAAKAINESGRSVIEQSVAVA